MFGKFQHTKYTDEASNNIVDTNINVIWDLKKRTGGHLDNIFIVERNYESYGEEMFSDYDIVQAENEDDGDLES